MDSSSTSNTRFGRAAAGAVERAPRAESDELEAFAAEIAGSLAAAQAAQCRPLAFGAEAPAGWQGGGGGLTVLHDSTNPSGLTAGNAETSGPLAAGESPELLDEKLQIRLDGGKLGEIAVVFERDERGLTMQLAVENAEAFEAFSAERGALEQVLGGLGPGLARVTLIRMEGFGTNLAQRRLDPDEKSRGATRQSSGESAEAERQRKSRRVNLIG